MVKLHKGLLLHIKVQWLFGRKALELSWKLNKPFLSSDTNLIERMTDRKTMVNKTWIFGGHFLESGQSKPVTSRKTRQHLLPLIKFKLYLKQKLDFRKLLLPL